jgi:Chromo (CHRromatin Organisation MOdifier) domain
MADESGSASGELVSSDDISLNSSDSEQEAEYMVEQILAERLSDDSRPRYLVKWEEYGEERCGLAFPSPPSPPPDVCSLTQFFPFPLICLIC